MQSAAPALLPAFRSRPGPDVHLHGSCRSGHQVRNGGPVWLGLAPLSLSESTSRRSAPSPGTEVTNDAREGSRAALPPAPANHRDEWDPNPPARWTVVPAGAGTRVHRAGRPLPNGEGWKAWLSSTSQRSARPWLMRRTAGKSVRRAAMPRWSHFPNRPAGSLGAARMARGNECCPRLGCRRPRPPRSRNPPAGVL